MLDPLNKPYDLRGGSRAEKAESEHFVLWSKYLHL